MKILLTGATGFIGNRLAHALHAAGHDLRCVVRRPVPSADLPPCELVAGDFARDHDSERWRERLAGIDAVVNTVGIFEERPGQTFRDLHTLTPIALFDACADAGIEQVIQVSALGADADAPGEFLRSKFEADCHLLQRIPVATVLQPSLVFGEEGRSARLFGLLALLPLRVLPDGGRALVQPVHIDDLVRAVSMLLQRPVAGRLALVGPQALPLRDYIDRLRLAFGRRRPALTLGIDADWLAKLHRWLPLPWLQPDALAMLRRGSQGDAGPMGDLLQRPPRPPAQFVSAGGALQRSLRFDGLMLVLRLALALMWIVTGIVSLGLFPTSESYALLQRSDVPPLLQPVALYGAALLDIVLGVATLCIRRGHWLWLAQLFLILLYTLVISLKLPEFWLHPYGPILKNLPVAAAITLFYWGKQR